MKNQITYTEHNGLYYPDLALPEKFHDCWSEYMSLGEAAIFEYAFKLGMQIAIETLSN